MMPSNTLLMVHMIQACSPFSPSEGASSHGRALEELVALFGKRLNVGLWTQSRQMKK
jgi:hypothetical protein